MLSLSCYNCRHDKSCNRSSIKAFDWTFPDSSGNKLADQGNRADSSDNKFAATLKWTGPVWE